MESHLSSLTDALPAQVAENTLAWSSAIGGQFSASEIQTIIRYDLMRQGFSLVHSTKASYLVIEQKEKGLAPYSVFAFTKAQMQRLTALHHNTPDRYLEDTIQRSYTTRWPDRKAIFDDMKFMTYCLDHDVDLQRFEYRYLDLLILEDEKS